MDATDRAKGRYRLLLEQISDEHGGERGWQTRAAERLGVKPEFVNMVMKDRRSGELDAIGKAMDRLGLDAAFFFGTFDAEPHYRDFVSKARAKVPNEPPFWREFLDRYPHRAALSESDLEDIQRFAARRLRVRSWTDWERIAEMVRVSKAEESSTAETSEPPPKKRRR
jgi:transcriptional regulator with XRE-family HTH domain